MNKEDWHRWESQIEMLRESFMQRFNVFPVFDYGMSEIDLKSLETELNNGKKKVPYAYRPGKHVRVFAIRLSKNKIELINSDNKVIDTTRHKWETDIKVTVFHIDHMVSTFIKAIKQPSVAKLVSEAKKRTKKRLQRKKDLYDILTYRQKHKEKNNRDL